MRKKRWLLVWVGIGVLFVGPPALLLNMNRSRVYERFMADGRALGEPAIVAAAQDVEGILADGEIGVVRPFEGLGKVQWVAITPDGRRALCCVGNSSLQFVDLQTCKASGSAFGGTQAAAACFSPDGKRAAVIAAWNMVYHFDTTTPPAMMLIGSVYGQSGQLRSVAIAPNGNTAAAGGVDRTVWIWNLKTHQELGYLVQQSAKANSAATQVCAVAYSADGTVLFSLGDDGTLCGWDIRSGYLGYNQVVHDGHVFSAAFSKDRKYLAVGGEDRRVRVWDIARHASVWKSEEHSSVVQQMDFSRDGRRLLAQSSNDLVLWDIVTGRKLNSIRIEGSGNSRQSNQPIVALHPDGRHVIVGGDKPGIVTMLAAEATTKPTTRAASDR